jgi:hypothetical protein
MPEAASATQNTAIFWIEIICALTIPISVVAVVWHRVTRDMGMGYRALQFLAIGVVVPAVIILALEGKLAGEAVAAIIGGVVAYLFTATKGSE